MIYRIDLFIVAAIAVVVIVRLPRALALLGSPYEWTSGHILRYVPYERPARMVQLRQQSSPATSKEAESTDDAHTLYSYSHANHVQRVNANGAPTKMYYPPHVASCTRLLRGVLAPLRLRITPGFSIAQVILLSLYFYVLVYAAFYKSNPFTDPMRTAWLAIGQLPFVFAFAAKNNVLGALIGLGYEKLNFLHRFVGRLVVLAANIHSIYYFYKWSLAGTFVASMQRSSNAWGMVALVCVDMLFFFSTAFWRQKAYNIFISTHIIGFVLVLPATYLHKPTMLPYILASVGFLALDQILRLLKTRITMATVRPLPELECTRIEIPGINSGWRAGQHVRVRVYSFAMGWFSWIESHPFTIASVSGGPEGIVLLCKKTGTWTTKLYDMAKTNGFVERGVVAREVRVMVEGPYGGPGHTIFASFSAAVFVAGGSGITFALSAIQDLVQKDLKGRSRVKVIELVWVVTDPASLVPLVPLFTSLIQQSVFTPIRISVYYTRAPIGKFPFASDNFIHGLTLAPGRPRIAKVLESAISRAVSLGAGVKDTVGITGLVVGVCGPVSIADDVAKAVGAIEPLRRDQVGGIEIHEECASSFLFFITHTNYAVCALQSFRLVAGYLALAGSVPYSINHLYLRFCYSEMVSGKEVIFKCIRSLFLFIHRRIHIISFVHFSQSST
ncbi:hypothetical protein BDQ12DRAFT_608543 [Crucibulum laeve]|uniref:ferric-chelate reductase (NADPH) n=1 Tax=Crucibulum laeve TaxID=68775 RepID=A0A5C3M787_9AGAR|nr:hypothetical protein BDQ12DRAFT_608543 [Crucibulum laeve]